MTAVGQVRRAVMVYPEDEPIIPPLPDMSKMSLNGEVSIIFIFIDLLNIQIRLFFIK